MPEKCPYLPGKGCDLAGVRASGEGVDEVLAGRVHVDPAAVIAEVRAAAPVGRERSDRDDSRGTPPGQHGFRSSLFPAGTTHTTPLCWRRCSIQASKAISGRLFLVGDATVTWKISAPYANPSLSFGTKSDSSALPAVSKTFLTTISAPGAMDRMTPATNVPCAAIGQDRAVCRDQRVVVARHAVQPRAVGVTVSGTIPVSAT